jgi:hypothetical protein
MHLKNLSVKGYASLVHQEVCGTEIIEDCGVSEHYRVNCSPIPSCHQDLTSSLVFLKATQLRQWCGHGFISSWLVFFLELVKELSCIHGSFTLLSCEEASLSEHSSSRPVVICTRYMSI